jgi:large subunit ribosomal protein L29
MRADDIRGMSEQDATTRLAELERERFNLRFKSGTQPLEDPLRLRALRKDIARLKTIVKERALGLDRTAKADAAATRAPAKKTAARKTTAKKTAAKTTAAKAPAKSAAKKTAAEQGGAKQSTSKATAAKKTATKRAAGGRGDR